ncbi:RVT_1 domain-containing protein/NMT domain-containing protein/NMT_C domain-containing protein/Lycopene_cycl domain-containing protein, partial [Cephalotus follicularis]
DNSPPGSPTENPDQNLESNQLPNDESSLETIVRKFQDSMSIGKKHKFWETQPVGQFKEVGDSSLPEGPIESPTPLSEVKQDPYNLPSPYEWTTCDMDSEETCNEVYNLLKNNYVEDDENMFRFNYSKEFLRWALHSPGYYKSWHIGVRAKSSKKLVAFITGVPARIRVRDEIVKMAEINFLCVHKKLRSKRLAPVMIKEVTRRVHLENIWQAAYTAGVVLPTPITTCQYWHRSLNPKKLIDVGFSRLGARMTMSRTIKLYKLPESPATPGFRKLELRDVPAVTQLLRNYLKQFVVAPDFDDNDVEHWLLPTENVVDSYLVESPETHEITDFCRATYQRLVNKIFESQIGRNMEVYVDDMLVKTPGGNPHIKDLGETFEVLRRYQMKLNPSKCTFGVSSGKFLGFMVSDRGIEANPEKISAVQELRPPQTIRDVQMLSGRIAALSRFVSKSAERCLPFFRVLRDPKGFSWSEECQAAFDKLKKYLASPPLISKPKDGENLYLYLAAAPGAVSAVLVREEEQVQRPVYYVSKALNDAEGRYPEVERFAYALIIAARKLRPYFQAHPIKVLTDQPLRQVLARPDTSGRLVKWSVELGEYDVKFEARSAVKSQVLADFVGDNTPTECMEENPSESEREVWKLSVHGSSCLTGSGAWVLLVNPSGWTLEYALRFGFKATNNEAEWEALIAGLTIARHLEKMECIGARNFAAMTMSFWPTGRHRRRGVTLRGKERKRKNRFQIRASGSSSVGSESCVLVTKSIADEEDFKKAGGSQLLLVQMQQNKLMDKQSKFADKLPPISVGDDVLDLVVIGCGPAGLALAAESAKLGLRVGLIGPDLPFTNNYGVWEDEFKDLGLEGCIEHVWQDTIVYLDDNDPILIGRAYGRVSRHLLHEELLNRCAESGVSYLSSKVERITEATNGLSLIACDHDIIVPCRLATVASGAASGKLLEYEVGGPQVSVQTAYGVEVEVENNPYDPNMMVFMDYRDYIKQEVPCLKDQYPTFLYVMPISSTRVFFEETCLASKDAMPFDLLKRKLMLRLQKMGIRVLKTYEEEWSYIPVGGSLPNTEQKNLAFGAAACMVHPATGYSVVRSLSEAPQYASVIANILKRGHTNGLFTRRRVNENISMLAWDSLWPLERKRQRAFFLFGLALILQLDIDGIRSFFHTFFRLPNWMWQGFLGSTLSSADLILFAFYMFVIAPNDMRMSLIRHLLFDPTGATMIKTYLTL